MQILIFTFSHFKGKREDKKFSRYLCWRNFREGNGTQLVAN